MNILEVHCLNKFCHPLLDDITSNRRNIFILYIDTGDDRKRVKRLYRILKERKFSMKLKTLSSIRNLYHIFTQMHLHEESFVFMLLPSIYCSEETEIRDILQKLVIRTSGNIELIPVIFDNQCTREELISFKSVDLSGTPSTWWETLLPVFGRPVGSIHSWLVQEMVPNDEIDEFLEDFRSIKSKLVSLSDNTLSKALEIISDHLNLVALLRQHCSTNSPDQNKKWPTCPELSKDRICTLQASPDGGIIDGDFESDSFHFIMQDISVLTTNPKKNISKEAPCPLSKMTHVYFVHNNDADTLSKLNLMTTLLKIYGFKCFTSQDILPGERLLDRAIKANEQSIATAVIDFQCLNKIQNAAAQYATVEYIKGNTKFIPVFYSAGEQNPNRCELSKYIDNLLIPLDITGSHTIWWPKLLSLLEQSFKKDSSGIFKTSTDDLSLLKDIHRISEKMKTTLHQLQDKFKRYAIYLLLKDEDFVQFVKQAGSSVLHKASNNTYPPTKHTRHVQQICHTWDESTSSSSTVTEASVYDLDVVGTHNDVHEDDLEHCNDLPEQGIRPFKNQAHIGQSVDNILDMGIDCESYESDSSETVEERCCTGLFGRNHTPKHRITDIPSYRNSISSSGYYSIPVGRSRSRSLINADSRSVSMVFSQAIYPKPNTSSIKPEFNRRISQDLHSAVSYGRISHMKCSECSDSCTFTSAGDFCCKYKRWIIIFIVASVVISIAVFVVELIGKFTKY